MNICEYIRQSDHPWFNTVDYTPTQVTLFTIGARLWCAAYMKTIHMLFFIEKSKR